MDGRVLREFSADVLQFGFLLVAGNRSAASLPGGDALLQGDVVEPATQPEHTLQFPLLLRSGPEPVLVGPAEALPFHFRLFCLIDYTVESLVLLAQSVAEARLTAWAQAQR